MSALEFLAAAALAIYAMMGGALLNAAITAPDKCRRVLIKVRRLLWPSFSSGLALLIVAICNRYWWGRTVSIFEDASLWLAITQFSLVVLISLAEMFCNAADEGASQHEVTRAHDDIKGE